LAKIYDDPKSFGPFAWRIANFGDELDRCPCGTGVYTIRIQLHAMPIGIPRAALNGMRLKKAGLAIIAFFGSN